MARLVCRAVQRTDRHCIQFCLRGFNIAFKSLHEDLAVKAGRNWRKEAKRDGARPPDQAPPWPKMAGIEGDRHDRDVARVPSG
jgi:hypothetical protein